MQATKSGHRSLGRTRAARGSRRRIERLITAPRSFSVIFPPFADCRGRRSTCYIVNVTERPGRYFHFCRRAEISPVRGDHVRTITGRGPAVFVLAVSTTERRRERLSTFDNRRIYRSICRRAGSLGFLPRIRSDPGLAARLSRGAAKPATPYTSRGSTNANSSLPIASLY